ncbi:hypothetical protein A9Q84_01700 [Halobacteriovorax marinus]|uniref:Uncharacterized protein n=1 Tax=Halobacteriovorax marinus TaxID=97084 RepID=A0A1Y5FG88_9BACT|nr:hypothetical protein A9Q84_01700 [Halobacteriovorax marinus]
MIRKLFLTFLLSTSILAGNVPAEGEAEVNSKIILRHFHQFTPKITSLIEYNWSQEELERKEKSLKLGFKYRVHNNVKLGIFYKRAYGLRHDDDWVWQNMKWLWNDTNSRGENILIGEAGYKKLFGNYIFETRLTYEHNFFNDHDAIKVRPGVTYLVLDEGAAFINLFLNYEAYLPLNFSEKSIYEQWIYAGLLYHYSDVIKPGVFYNFRKGYWTSSKDFKDKNLGKYEQTHSSHYLGVSLNIYY